MCHDTGCFGCGLRDYLHEGRIEVRLGTTCSYMHGKSGCEVCWSASETGEIKQKYEMNSELVDQMPETVGVNRRVRSFAMKSFDALIISDQEVPSVSSIANDTGILLLTSGRSDVRSLLPEARVSESWAELIFPGRTRAA